MAIYLTCPKSGLCWTVQDDYNSKCFINSVHPLYYQLPKEIEKRKWKMPPSYLVAGILYHLTENGLITVEHTESPLTRSLLSQILCRTYTASQLYSLYSKCRDTRAAVISSPLRINLSTLLEQDPKQIWIGIETVAIQSLSEADKAQLYSESHRTNSRRKRATLSLHKGKITKTQSLSPETSLNRVAKHLLPLYDNLCKDQSINFTTPLSRTIIKQTVQQLPNYSILASKIQQEINTILTTVYDMGIKNSFLSVDSLEYKSYFNVRMQIEQGLVPNKVNNILGLKL